LFEERDLGLRAQSRKLEKLIEHPCQDYTLI